MFQRWVRGTQYYEAEARFDLFGQACVVVTYGGVDTARGRRFTMPCGDETGAEALFKAVARRRQARGYSRRSA